MAVPVLLGPRWAPAVPVTRAMAVLALLRALTIPVSGLLGARGRSAREFGWSLTVLAAAVLVMRAAAAGSVLVVARTYAGLWAILFVLAYLWLVRPVAGVPPARTSGPAWSPWGRRRRWPWW